ncbi:Fic family protein [Sphingosinicella microcystinivorans]|uniref:Fic family protein n=1 Tax=Sphingosinicella microcystinivorans TaxID=335406 RepID=UPI0022F39ED9|nr:Fic family protein [Sphingosinicella microcystinivorans]WBX83817.1 Fic family protein [Sphingosinicella microcystinivorans]
MKINYSSLDEEWTWKRTLIVQDRGEPVDIMQPMRVGEGSPRLGLLRDLSVDLAAKAASFRASLPSEIQAALAHLVRAMNCYYSNLIEGHDTHPIDIERALNNDFSDNPEQRDLQLEARAHIAVQEWIDAGGLSGRAHTVAGLSEIHARFCENLPESLLWVEMPESRERVRVEPGLPRTRDVQVGRHVAVSPGAVPRFLEHFEHCYANLGRSDAIIAVAAAHHRFVWIHPFLDGNGRTARLMSHAMLLETLDTGGVWSVARGLGRTAQDYKRHLAACDLPRRNDLDGRGALSEEELAAFTAYFLKTCIDQVDFMTSLVEPTRFRTRIHRWIEEEAALGKLPAKAGTIIDAILYRGELPRGELESVVGTGDRQARRVAATLLDLGVLVSESSRAPLRLAFPATLASRWMPGLFPDKD